MEEIIKKIRNERKAQDCQWGEQNHALPIWILVLTEEVGEVAQAILDARSKKKGYSDENYIQYIKEELIQVAAVAVAAIEYIERGNPTV